MASCVTYGRIELCLGICSLFNFLSLSNVVVSDADFTSSSLKGKCVNKSNLIRTRSLKINIIFQKIKIPLPQYLFLHALNIFYWDNPQLEMPLQSALLGQHTWHTSTPTLWSSRKEIWCSHKSGEVQRRSSNRQEGQTRSNGRYLYLFGNIWRFFIPKLVWLFLFFYSADILEKKTPREYCPALLF